MTKAHHDHDDLQTVHPDREHHEEVHDRIVYVNHYYDNCWGPEWREHHWGFYDSDDFWRGYHYGELEHRHDWDREPIWIVSPITQQPIGEIPPPIETSPWDFKTQLQMNVLNTMANPQQDPINFDPSAGLYEANPWFSPGNPGMRLSGESAYNILRNYGTVYFHPPNGAYERISGLDDLEPYLYSRETRREAPPQVVIGPVNPGPPPIQIDPNAASPLDRAILGELDQAGGLRAAIQQDDGTWVAGPQFDAFDAARALYNGNPVVVSVPGVGNYQPVHLDDVTTLAQGLTPAVAPNLQPVTISSYAELERLNGVEGMTSQNSAGALTDDDATTTAKLRQFEGGVPQPGYSTDAGFDFDTIQSMVGQGIPIPGTVQPTAPTTQITDLDGNRITAYDALGKLNNGQGIIVQTPSGDRVTVQVPSDLDPLLDGQ